MNEAPLLLGATLMVSIWISGYGLARYLGGVGSELAAAAVAFPLAGGLWTWSIFLLGWWGARVSSRLYLGVGAVFLFLSFLLWARANGGHDDQDDPRIRGRERWVVLTVASMAVGLLAAIAIGRSYSTWDAMAIWSVKGYGIVAEGSIFAAREWGAHGLTYPLNLPLLIGAFQSIAGDSLPISKAIFPAFFVSLLLGLYLFLRNRGSSPGFAATGCLVLATIPLLLDHATNGYANLPFATYLLLAAILLADGRTTGRSGLRVLSGGLLGLAMWTRPEGIFIVPTYAVLLVAYWRARREAFRQWMAWAVPLMLLGGAWLIFNASYGVTGLLDEGVEEAAAAWGRLDLNFGGLWQITRFLGGRYLEFSTWGVAVPLTILLIAVRIRSVDLWDPERVLMGILAVAAGLPVLVFYYFLSFRSDFSYWLFTGLNRLMIPATLAAVLWSLSLAVPSRPESPVSSDPNPPML